jgi:hypothetical protein
MKRNQKILVTAVLSAVSALVLNTAMAADALSIKDTPHNLGAGNSGTGTPNAAGAIPNHSSNTAEICVFCHTPHGGDNGAAVPIWNRKLGPDGAGVAAALTGYKRYSSLGTTTFDAQEAPIGSVSIACLSCHDGTQAIDNVINMPGSGGYNPTTGTQIGNFVGGDQTSGKLAATVVQNLTTDLSNDHPVSMQFGGGGITVTAVANKTVDPDFFTPSVMNAPGNTLGKLWYIESAANAGGLQPGSRDREDVILYTRNDVTNGSAVYQPTVECGSCHDPHNFKNQTFLRISNTGAAGAALTANTFGLSYTKASGGPSGLCLTCHNK